MVRSYYHFGRNTYPHKRSLEELLANAGQAPEEQVTSNDSSKFRQIIRLRTLHILAVWALIYIGIEVTMGGMLAII